MNILLQKNRDRRQINEVSLSFPQTHIENGCIWVVPIIFDSCEGCLCGGVLLWPQTEGLLAEYRLCLWTPLAKVGKSMKTKSFLVTRGREGSPCWTGCSGSLPCPFRVLAVWALCPGRVGERAETDWGWAGLALCFGPGWQRGEQARCSLGQTPPPPASLSPLRCCCCRRCCYLALIPPQHARPQRQDNNQTPHELLPENGIIIKVERVHFLKIPVAV